MSVGAPDIHYMVCRTGDEPPSRRRVGRPASGAQMQPGPERSGQAPVAGDDERKAALPADAGERVAQRGAVQIVIMAQHNAAKAFGQPACGGDGVGQARRIREKP